MNFYRRFLLFFVIAFSIIVPAPTSASTILSAPYIGTPIDFSYATSYGTQTYLFDASTTPTTAPISYIRIKRLSGSASCALNIGYSGDVHLFITDQSGALLTRADGVNISGQYCTYHLSSIIPVGTILGSVSIYLQYSDRTFVLDGSSQNSGMLRSGTGTTQMGSFAFELCDDGGCDGQFTLPPGYVVPPSNQQPTLTLRGESTLYVEKGAPFTDPHAIASDPEDGDISGNISVSGVVDTSNIGTSTLTYSVMDSAWGTATPITRTVIVYDAGNILLCQSGSSYYRQTPTYQYNLWSNDGIPACGGNGGWLLQGDAGYFRTYATTDYPAGSTKGYFHLVEGGSSLTNLDCASEVGDLVNDLGFAYNPTGVGPGNPVVIPVHGSQCTVPRIADGRSYWWKFECAEGSCAAGYSNWKAHIGFGYAGSGLWAQTWSGEYNPPIPPKTCTPGTDGCFSDVMFLPGLMGSRLYDENGDELWVSSRFFGADAKQAKLALNTHGTSTYSIHTKDDTQNTGELDETGIVDDVYSANIYQSFIGDLRDWKTDGTIENYAFIPYDWRLSLDAIITNGATSSSDTLSYGTPQSFEESYILKQLEQLQKSSKTGKVTIVAHSNGGLVAKALIQKLKETDNPLYDKIDEVILVAVPQVGTPDAVKALLHGSGLGPWNTIMSPERLRDLSKNMPGVYNQLPSTEYFNAPGTIHSLAVFDPSSYYAGSVSQYGNTVNTYDELEKYLKNTENRLPAAYHDLNHASILNSDLVTAASTTHAFLDAWRPATSTKVVEVAGWGEYTLSALDYRAEKECLHSEYVFEGLALVSRCTQYADKQVLYTYDTLDGDGTVVSPSATYLSDKNVPNVERWWVDLKGYNSNAIVARDHKDILEVDKLRDFIKSKVTGITSTFQYISSAKPIFTKNYTRIQLNSPLTLNLYDSAGNHTGLSATGEVEENIPGSRYRTIGESKYILVPQDIATTLKLEGYQEGSFSLNIDHLSGDTVTASTTFAAIPSSTSTVATMDLPTNTEIQSLGSLKVDFNGDGTIDTQLVPKVGEIVLPDTAAPVTSVSLSGTLGNNSYYTSDVTVMFSAVDDVLSGEISSGVAKTEYSLDEGVTWNNYTVPFVVATEGTTTIQYRSIDGLGNEEQVKTEVVRLDKTVPTIFASDTSAEQLTEAGTLLAISATVEDGIDSNPTLTTDVPLTQTFSPGVTSIHLTATDLAGNIATSSITVTIYSSPTADPDGDGVPNQDDVKPFDAIVFANLIIPSEYSLWEKESFDLPFSVAGKGGVTLTFSNTYYLVGASPVKDSAGATVPATVTTTDGVTTISFSQSTKDLKTYTLTITTKKGNTKERDSIKKKRDNETDSEKRHDLEKELDFASAPITLNITNITTNATTSQTAVVNIYDKEQNAQIQYKYKDTDHSTTFVLKSDEIIKLKKGQPLVLTVKVTGIKRDVSFTSNITGNFTMLNVSQEEEHKDKNDRKQTKFSFFYPLSTQTTEEPITVTTTVNGITKTDVVRVRFEE